VLVAAAVNPVLAWRLEASLRHSLGTPDVGVRLVGWPTAAITGRYVGVSMVARRASAGGLALDEVSVHFRGVRLDVLRAVLFGQFIVRSADGGRATVRLRQEDVQRALEDRSHVEGVTVKLAGGRAHLAGTVTVAGAKVDVELAGTLVVENSRHVFLHVETMDVYGFSLPPGVANLVVAPLNPLLSADRLPVPLRLTAVEVRDGAAVISAEPINVAPTPPIR